MKINRLRREEYVKCGPVFLPLTAAPPLAIVREEHLPVKEELFMELHRTEQGFALYKEKDCIGECTLSPAPKGAQLAAHSVGGRQAKCRRSVSEAD